MATTPPTPITALQPADLHEHVIGEHPYANRYESFSECECSGTVEYYVVGAFTDWWLCACIDCDNLFWRYRDTDKNQTN